MKAGEIPIILTVILIVTPLMMVFLFEQSIKNKLTN